MSLDQEMWLQQRIERAAQLPHGFAFDGTTTPEVRRERMRFAILSHELDSKHCGRRQGQSMSFADMYQQIYGAPL